MEQLYLVDFLKFTQKLARSEVKALFYIRLAKNNTAHSFFSMASRTSA